MEVIRSLRRVEVIIMRRGPNWHAHILVMCTFVISKFLIRIYSIHLAISVFMVAEEAAV